MLTKKVTKPRIGLYGVGLKAYWSQFEGLKNRLVGYIDFIEGKLSAHGEVFNFGLVDDETRGRDAGEFFNANNVDIIFMYSATYCTSSCVLPVHQICSAPLVILNMQPAVQMNYSETSTGQWLAHCGACPVPEFTSVFERAGIKCRIVNGLLGQSETPAVSITDENTAQRPEAIKAWQQIDDWCKAAGVKRMLGKARFGFLGNNYSGMLDMYSDYTMLSAQLGLHIELVEMCDLEKHFKDISDYEVKQKVEEIERFFVISGDSPSDPIAKKPTNEQMAWSAKVAVAQEKLVGEYSLDALTYYYHGTGDNYYERLQGGFIVGHSLLTASGIPCAGEGDLKTNVAMKICDALNTGGSYTEIVGTDYNFGTMILGHDGPFHILISNGKPVLRGMGVYHGKKGSGVSVEANVKTGAITTLGVTQTCDGNLKMIISEGEALQHPTLMVGNTSTHVKFPLTPAEYMDKWFKEAPTHHCAMAVGHNKDLFTKTADLLEISSVIV
ncbi:MAG: L-fucose/L-arabinose isomerase family protein [Clostridia bacterium]|jgi:L-arabinose isomerase|nr:L-fucose/L-arabinose isomerase family protein [Clostridia bacterium]MBT7121372.1 L-fucose/L-arabinose isomerase family protein [Clostridia bacterium]